MSDEEIIKAYHTHLAQKISVKLSLPEAEVLSKISSKEQIEAIVRQAGLVLEKYDVSPADLFIQAVLVVRRP
jgi:hypothetical protein